jgi:ketosteroid isomerase-like protein
MAHPNSDLLRQGYEAFDKGDLDTIRGLFADDIVFHVSGSHQLSGDYRGQDEVFGFFGKIIELTGGTYKIDVHAIIADDDHGVVLSSATAERDGRALSERSVDVHHIRDGKVAEVWTFDEDQQAVDEFFS